MKRLSKNKKICVKEGQSFKLKSFDTSERCGFDNESEIKEELSSYKEKIATLQEKLYAQDKYSLLIILQAIDAAGKDSCIKHVLSGVNPQGCSVTSFKAPTDKELAHEFMWRAHMHMPEKGMIGVFNRSYYEELLVCKVHPEFILKQRIPGIESVENIDESFWENRYKIIRETEKHWINNGTVVIKIFLNMGKEEQKKRFLERIDVPSKNWKFNINDLTERQLWKQYQKAYQEMIAETSTKQAPWYVIPADNQWVSRAIVGRIILEHLEALQLNYPEMDQVAKNTMAEARKKLLSEKD